MPVAKNLKLADALGISTRLLNQSGLPLSVVSASASSPKCSSINVAIRFKILNLSSAGVIDHCENAFLAAVTATSISFSLLSGIWQNISPVAGLILSINFPLSGPIRFPPMKFSK